MLCCAVLTLLLRNVVATNQSSLYLFVSFVFRQFGAGSFYRSAEVRVCSARVPGLLGKACSVPRRTGRFCAPLSSQHQPATVRMTVGSPAAAAAAESTAQRWSDPWALHHIQHRLDVWGRAAIITEEDLQLLQQLSRGELLRIAEDLGLEPSREDAQTARDLVYFLIIHQSRLALAWLRAGSGVGAAASQHAGAGRRGPLTSTLVPLMFTAEGTRLLLDVIAAAEALARGPPGDTRRCSVVAAQCVC